MTTLCTADLHFSANPRDAYRFHFLERELPRLVEEHAVRRVLVLGDLCEAKDSHPAALVNRVVDGFARLAENGADLYFLRGNHDYVAEAAPFFQFLRHVPRAQWFNEPTALTLRGLGLCLFLPHTPDWHRDWADLRWDMDDAMWIFCHQTFSGAVSEHGRKLEGKGAPFKKGARVVSGDVHVPQKVGPVTYVGSPYLIDFGDDWEPRVLLLDGTKLRSVPARGPQKRLVSISGKDPLHALRLDKEHPLAEALGVGLQSGDVVKVRVELPEESKLSRADVRAAVRTWAEEVGVQLYGPEIISAKPDKKEIDRHPRRSDEELVRGYTAKMGQGRTTVAAGLKLMEKTT